MFTIAQPLPISSTEYRVALTYRLQNIITIVLSGKDGEHRKHGVAQSFWIHQIVESYFIAKTYIWLSSTIAIAIESKFGTLWTFLVLPSIFKSS